MTQQLNLFDKPRTAKETHRNKVLRMLSDSELGVCSTEFLKARMPRFSARLKELRNMGHEIENRKCFATSHRHTSHQVRYILLAPRRHRQSLSE